MQSTMASSRTIASTRACITGYSSSAISRRVMIRHASSKPPRSSPRPPPPPPTKTTTPATPKKNKPLPYQPKSQPPAPTPPPGSSTKSSGNEAQPMSDLVRQRWLPIFGMGAAALCLGSVVASAIYHWRNDEVVRYPPGKEPQVPTGRATIQSPVEFDLHLDKSESRLGITDLRRRLAAQASGHVLEVAVGAGRNLEFYDWNRITEQLLDTAERVKLRLKLTKEGREGGGKLQNYEHDQHAIASFTGIDISPPMLDIAMKRMRLVVPHIAERGVLPSKPVWTLFSQHATKTAALGSSSDGDAIYSVLDDKIRIVQCDAQKTMPPPPPPPPPRSNTTQPQYYDTVVQTFGLCSVRDPVGLIAKMAQVCRPGTGRIIMVEHGLSWWDLINGFLDRSARGHFERFGCWWNRDIEGIVREAAESTPGLEVVAFERPGWLTGGTHLWVELKVSSKDGVFGGPEVEKNAATAAADDAKRSGGWFSLDSILSVKKAADKVDHKEANVGDDKNTAATQEKTTTAAVVVDRNSETDKTKSDGWFNLGSLLAVQEKEQKKQTSDDDNDDDAESKKKKERKKEDQVIGKDGNGKGQ